jgi:hypothetical protein
VGEGDGEGEGEAEGVGVAVPNLAIFMMMVGCVHARPYWV